DVRWWGVGYRVACAFGARAVFDVAQDARRTVVGCRISRSLRLWRKVRWLMSRKMRDLRRWDVRCRDG
ncbi:hypothetical protein, partial [Idiomarina sp.]|uniref:hypothetical protein n=1 Tax=Idiomarina sp. TaxID=1874361 RepID=UPI00258A1B3C